MPMTQQAELIHTSNKIRGFIERLTRSQGHFDSERRSHPRFVYGMAIDARNVDDDFRPFGDVFQVVMRDVSEEGIGLFYSEPVFNRFLRLELPIPGDQPETLCSIIEVLRCKPMVSGIFDIGGKFVTLD